MRVAHRARISRDRVSGSLRAYGRVFLNLGTPGSRIMAFDYKPRHVAFADILGFKEKVDRINDHQELFEYLITMPTVVASKIKAANDAFGAEVDLQGTVFSDSVVISATAMDERIISLYAVVETVSAFSQELLRRGALVRGGIVTASTYHREGVSFGRGIIDAWQVEQSAARVPRIVVAPDLAAYWYEYFGREGGMVANLGRIARDQDGLDFVDIFHFPENDSWDVGTNSFFLAAHEQLTHNLSDRTVRLDVWSKAVWIAQRYNSSDVVARRRASPPVVIPEYHAVGALTSVRRTFG
jgi:hypothetical protein